MVCVACFKNEGLRRLAEHLASAPVTKCARCGSSASSLTADEVNELAFEFFRNGSIPTRSQFGTERYRISNHDSRSRAKFRSSLAADCELLRSEANLYVYQYEPSPLWRIGCGDIQLALQAGGRETEEVLNRLTSSVPVVTLPSGTTLYRVRIGAVAPDPWEFDPPPVTRDSFGRFDSSECEVLYTARDVETCLHEMRVAIPDEITLATLRLRRDLRVADLTAFPQEGPSHQSLELLCRTFCLGGEDHYDSCRRVAIALRSAGFDGFIYESYFSLVRPDAPKNVAIFGRPLSSGGTIDLVSVNAVWLRQVGYAYELGPAPGDEAPGDKAD